MKNSVESGSMLSKNETENERDVFEVKQNIENILQRQGTKISENLYSSQLSTGEDENWQENQCIGNFTDIIPIVKNELNKANKLLEKDETTNILLESYEAEKKVLELTKQVEIERLKVQKLYKNLRDKKQRLDKRTAEYNELSAQLMDNLQDTDAYKEQVEHLERAIQHRATTEAKLRTDLEALRQNSAKDLEAQDEKNKILHAQLKEARKHIERLESQNKILSSKNGEMNDCCEEKPNKDEIPPVDEKIQLEEAEHEIQDQLGIQERYLHHIKLLQEENYDLTIAVQELSMKIVTLEDQIVRPDVQDGIITNKLKTCLEVIKEEKEQLSENVLELQPIAKETIPSKNKATEGNGLLQILNEKQSEERNLPKSLDESMHENEKLLARLLSLENDMEESANIREHLEQEVCALKVDLGNLDRQLKEYNAKVERLQKQNDNCRHELQKKTDEVDRSTKELRMMQQSIEYLEQELIQERQENNDRMEENKTLLLRLEDYAERHETLEQKEDLTKEVEKLEVEVSVLSDRLKDGSKVKRELEISLELIERLRSETNDLKTCINTEQKYSSKLKHRIDESVKIKRELEHEISVLQANHKTILRTYADLMTKQQPLEEQLTKCEARLIETEETLTARTDDPHNLIEDHNRKLDEKEKTISELSERISKLEQEKIELQKLVFSEKQNKPRDQQRTVSCSPLIVNCNLTESYPINTMQISEATTELNTVGHLQIFEHDGEQSQPALNFVNNTKHRSLDANPPKHEEVSAIHRGVDWKRRSCRQSKHDSLRGLPSKT
ncbi:myosin-10-like [Topomyia yanbarensis]|uniref:myosin-10-like n=1 Tax=Topomyia yanbarensis TaxID=2498891 RepID=UPI00273B4787|nr:myosin-10-like [Topomyia yanbarensis]XP_058830816.1 myosin-10-like [Topomyia yanbarensis]XP_058830817.1 myosin-10-like [Topomyia yanbarensis]XP_058830818.1 myosin-10-like [Topomyia yanbarensis]XP_058830819.1 myosin-10-like [Topomyia yanbarensis]